ncbi:response regulator transcription factor [Pararobbsia silviterrae]|uniref:DNA-binding response regulator n=1 Tax=Pararobbsia silviterrae TaxID=1792498 RepID=A0A494XNM1_9BURK|nr:response regulator [Pararobbsia silviterrae]RKP49684.1 DNA-binding response regulator [Pararobbsia silviterrae]
MNRRPTIYIVDDDAQILWLYQQILQELDATVHVFVSAREFLDSYAPGSAECLICDLRMPDISGLDVQRELREIGAAIPVIFASAYSEVPAVVEAVKAGAFDFVEKPVDGLQFRDKVRKALDHSRALGSRRMDAQAQQSRLASLTPKEREIAEFVISGLSSRKISEKLGISIRTVQNHRARIAEKLQLDSTIDLVRLFYGDR